jgi:hypothetical protein
VLRGQLGRLELGRLIWSGSRITLASAALAAVSFGVWSVLDDALGRGLGGQIASLGIALAAGGVVYAVAVVLLRVPEAQQIRDLVRRRSA